jgi:hypothetical protein
MSIGGSIPLADFLEQADTGDVVIWRGTSLISLSVELATFSIFSHSSIVIRDPKSHAKFLLQAAPVALLGDDPLSTQQTTKHDGVQAAPLEAAMLSVYGPAEHDFPSWRQLDWPNRPADFDANIWKLAASLDGTRFPWVPDSEYQSMGLMLGLLMLGREFDTEVLNPMFCSGLVAKMLQDSDVINKNMKINGYEPKDFSSLYPGVMQPCPGVKFNDDVLVVMPS